ncbi:MAG TPA: MATE family efflux transporter [Steroidobacter sp.]|uniref:MATE family efflux transporter n=1 Tax=Steroidobacter sp. TaxID=1978227 RepID=UPI002EDA866D
MKDLTQGSIAGHLISLAVPTAAGMLFQTLYYFVDLYFVAGLGDAAVAGVSAAGNAMFIVLALTQVLGVGTVALISHAVGRKDQQDANLVFNQSLLLAALCGLVVLVAGYSVAGPYLRSIAADEETIAHGRAYLYWFLPGMALQFAMVAMSSALRGTGIVKPTMIVQVLTVLLNTALAPVLIAGWGTGYAMGVAGAGLASTIAIIVGVIVLTLYFGRLEKYVSFHAEQWQPRMAVWKRMLTIGLPAGGEFALMFIYTAITYWAIRNFGAAAQAGFGIGSRIMQGIFLPAMAIAFVVAPVAGQNYGAKQMARVRETFRVASTQCIGVMLVVMVLCQWQPETLVAFFSKDPEVIRVGALFLHLISWNFVMSGLIFTCSGLFQALGNTVPALVSSATRLVLYALPLIWLTSQPGYQLEQVWYLSIAASAVQAILSVTLLRKQMRLQLGSPVTQPA